MFRLDAINAYNQKLVKKIEVKGIKQIGSTATNAMFIWRKSSSARAILRLASAMT